ncbi:MAG TPA: DUF6438 domain-containing protein [Candidatus Binatus sp.]|jgi:hypothetical protein|nr:DUF6438 domain-containing protein [Candidatus Binatus sp.]
MAFQKHVAVTVLIASFSFLLVKSGLGHGEQAPDLSSVSEADLKTVTIQLERVGCLGTCPAYSITIHGDGRVEYSGNGHVKETGGREGRIEPDKIRELLSQFAKAKFWDVAEDYTRAKCGRYCTDMATAVTAVTLKGATHRVKHYYGCGNAPKSLFELESSVDKTVDSEQWTGDVSKAGPYGTTCFGS